MTDIRTADGASVLVEASALRDRAAYVNVQCAPWGMESSAHLTAGEALAVRDALTALVPGPDDDRPVSGALAELARLRRERAGILRERDVAVADEVTSRARAQRAEEDASVIRDEAARVSRERAAALARATRAEESAADLMGKLAEANRARQVAEVRADALAADVRVLSATLANAEAARDAAQAEVMRRDEAPARDAHRATMRAVREAVRSAYAITEDYSAELALSRLGEALDELL